MTTAPKKIVSNSSSSREQARVLWFEEFGIADVPIALAAIQGFGTI